MSKCVVVILGAFALLCTASAAGASARPANPHQVSAHPGDIVRFEGIGAVVPAPGQGVITEAQTTNGGLSLHLWTTSDGRVFEDAVLPGPGGGAPANECTDTWEPGSGGWSWPSAFTWYFHSNSTPSGNNVANVETDLESATNHITNEYNVCGRSDSVSATNSYGGRLQQSSNIDSSGNCQARNGTSMTGFGTLPAGILAVTCIWVSGATALESDMRMNSASFTWYTDAGSGCQSSYNVDDIATHERGHTFGMLDEYSNNEETMYGYAGACQTNKESLALGDMLQLEAIY